jgi:hypothetical protein
VSSETPIAVRRRRSHRSTVAIAAVAALLGVLLSTFAVSGTSAAWTDRAVAAATVQAGTWSTLGTCTARTATGAAVGTCAIAKLTYDGWGVTGDHRRNYYVTFHVSAPASTSYITVQADLSAAAVGIDSSSGTWNWSKASTVPSRQFTPTSACAALPGVSGRTVAGWDWATSPQIYFQLTDSPLGRLSASCG